MPHDFNSWEATGDLQSDMATELLPTPVGPAMTMTRGLRSAEAVAAAARIALSECDESLAPPPAGNGRFMLRAVLEYRDEIGLGDVDGDDVGR